MGSGFKGNRNRQKMINLMYLVFIAMMALNVSSEVLDGFDKVDRSIEASISSTGSRNQLIMRELEAANVLNPSKAGIWLGRGREISSSGDSLYNFIEVLKHQIVRQSDGVSADIHDIKFKDDLEASSYVMLNPLTGKGSELRKRIEAYRVMAERLMTDATKLRALERVLSTNKPKGKLSWESALFEDMPTSAAITMLTKLQSDVRYAQGEVLADLLQAIDVGDYRVNKITAQVIPQSNIVMRGDVYRAQVVLSSVDSTKQPTVFVGDKVLDPSASGIFTLPATAPGTYPVQGYVELSRPDGTKLRREFKSEYFVTEPTASVAPTMMNVLYAGIDNPISIAAPGIPSQNLTVSMTNGTLIRKGELWVARPTKVGAEAVITVSAKMPDGRQIAMGTTKLRVRTLPDPMPYIDMPDGQRFKGGALRKAALLAAGGIKAAIDDNVLDVSYRVTKFSTTFYDSKGDAIPEVSDGASFSPRQLDKIRALQRGKRFYITDVYAVGPDGITRRIPTIEVIVN